MINNFLNCRRLFFVIVVNIPCHLGYMDPLALFKILIGVSCGDECAFVRLFGLPMHFIFCFSVCISISCSTGFCSKIWGFTDSSFKSNTGSVCTGIWVCRTLHGSGITIIESCRLRSTNDTVIGSYVVLVSSISNGTEWIGTRVRVLSDLLVVEFWTCQPDPVGRPSG